MVWDPITSSDWHHELWVRLRVTMNDGTKCAGWCFIPGDNDWLCNLEEVKPFKSFKPVVDLHIANRNWLPIYTYYGERDPIVEVNAHQIKTFTITDRIFGVPVEVWEAHDRARYQRYQAMRGDKNGD